MLLILPGLRGVSLADDTDRLPVLVSVANRAAGAIDCAPHETPETVSPNWLPRSSARSVQSRPRCAVLCAAHHATRRQSAPKCLRPIVRARVAAVLYALCPLRSASIALAACPINILTNAACGSAPRCTCCDASGP